MYSGDFFVVVIWFGVFLVFNKSFLAFDLRLSVRTHSTSCLTMCLSLGSLNKMYNLIFQAKMGYHLSEDGILGQLVSLYI